MLEGSRITIRELFLISSLRGGQNLIISSLTKASHFARSYVGQVGGLKGSLTWLELKMAAKKLL